MVSRSCLSLILVFSCSSAVLAQKPLTASATFQHAPTGRDPFNRTQANNTGGFITLLKRNAKLRAHFARHFRVPENEVVDFVRTSLVPYQMPAPRTMTTFGLARNGMIYPVTTHLKKGEKVWATREGVPVLKWACSNPLMRLLPGHELRNRPSRVAGIPNEDVTPIRPLPVGATSEDDTISRFVPLDLTNQQVALVTPTAPAFSPIVPGTPLDIPGALSSVGGGHGGPSFWLPLIVGATGIPLNIGGGSNNGGTPPVAVPESGSSLLLLAGTALLGLCHPVLRRSRTSR